MSLKFRPAALLSRGALALAVAAAAPLVIAPANAADKKAAAAPAAPKLSKTFIPSAQAMQKAIEDAKKKPSIQVAMTNLEQAIAAYNSANTSTARKAAGAQIDAANAALGAEITTEKALVDPMFTAAVSPDDKMVAGQLAAQLGTLGQDRALIRRGYQAMLESGKYPAADTPKLYNAIGDTCYEMKDYACAQDAYGKALAGGAGGESLGARMADSYFKANQVPQGLDALWKAIQARKAAGQPVPATWYGTGLNAAFRAKLLDQASAYSLAMVTDYPSTENWASAVRAVRYLANYEPQERMDLLRILVATKSFAEGADYVEFIQTADKLRLPAEELWGVQQGLASGGLQASDLFVTDARTLATKQIADEKPTLAAMEARAKAPGATPVAVSATADVLLSYGMPSNAEAMYQLALQRGGVDPMRLTTRLGIAQFLQGKYAEAKANFDKVTGPRKPMAAIWSALAANKAKGG